MCVFLNVFFPVWKRLDLIITQLSIKCVRLMGVLIILVVISLVKVYYVFSSEVINEMRYLNFTKFQVN